MSQVFEKQLRHNVYSGIPPQAERLGIGLVGTLRPPEPEQIVERIQASRYGFTVFERGWIHGTWYCGTKWKPSSYWGQFPGQFLQRVNVMFPVERMLHLCAGHEHIQGALNVDMMPVPSIDVQADVENLPLADSSFAVALIDPPYSDEDAKRYGVSRLISAPRVLKSVHRVLVPGGYLLWLDERYPAYRRRDWTLVGLIGIVTGFERRTRVLSFLRRTEFGASLAERNTP